MVENVFILLISEKEEWLNREKTLLNESLIKYDAAIIKDEEDLINILKAEFTPEHQLPNLAILDISDSLLFSETLLIGLRQMTKNREFLFEVFFLVKKINKEHLAFDGLNVHFIEKPLDTAKLKAILNKFNFDNELANSF